MPPDAVPPPKGSSAGRDQNAPLAQTQASEAPIAERMEPATVRVEGPAPSGHGRGRATRSQRRRGRRGIGRESGSSRAPPGNQAHPPVEVGTGRGRGRRLNSTRGRGRGVGIVGPGPITPMNTRSTGHSSLGSNRTQKSIEVMDQYATKRPDPAAIYPESWPLPNEEEFKARFLKKDISKLLRTKIIGKFSGKANDYGRFKAIFYPNVHVQREPAHIKAAALDSLMDPEVRDEVFGVGLGNDEWDYIERLERLERRFGGEERMIDFSLNKIKGLLGQSRKDYEKLRELVDTMYFFLRGVGHKDANSLSLREHLREGLPPALLKRYMEETAERGHPDTLAYMLEWTHRNITMHFKHKEFEELRDKSSGEKNKKKEKARKKKTPEEAFAFLAESETTSSSTGEEVPQVRYQTQENCAKCQGPHPLYKCEAFFFLLPVARRKFILEKELCLVCYGPNHVARNCRFVNYKCRFGCKSRHNTDLHVSAEDYKRLRTEQAASMREPEGTNEELAHLVSSMDQQDGDQAEEVCYMAGGTRAQTPPLHEGSGEWPLPPCL